MPNSINGWPVCDDVPWNDPRLRKEILTTTGTQLWVRKEAWPFFAALVNDYHRYIRKVTISDGYDYRQSRTSSAWSNHASGTAVDINYDKEGMAGRGPLAWWKRKRHAAKAVKIKKRYEIVNWGGATEVGGDYGPGYWDWMHWELKTGTTVADVERMIKKLGITPDGRRTKP